MIGERDQLRAVISDFVSRQDASLLDPALFERALQGKFGVPLKAEISALKAGLVERVPWNIRKGSETVATQKVIQALGAELTRKHLIPLELSCWAIESWALSLRMSIEPLAKVAPGGAPPGQSSVPPKASPSPRPPQSSPAVSPAVPASVPAAAPASVPATPVAPVAPSVYEPTTRMGLIYGIDDRGCIRVYQTWWNPVNSRESSAALVTHVKSELRSAVSLFSAAPPREKSVATPPAQASPTPPVSQKVPVQPVVNTHAPAAKPPLVASVPRPAPVASAKPASPAPLPVAPPQPLPRRIPASKAEELYDKAMELLANPKARGAVPQALQMLQQSAALGYLQAQTRLGEISLRGRVVKEDIPVAVQWLRLAAGKGDAEAQTLLGSLYQCGVGVPADRKEAQKWLQLAAKQGNPEAQTLLKQLLESLS